MARSVLTHKALQDHGVENFIIDVRPIVVQDLGRVDALPPDLIITRTLAKSILIPTAKVLCQSSHLDLPLQHTVDNLKQ